MTNLEIFVSIVGLFSGYFIVSRLLDNFYASKEPKDRNKYLPRNRLPEDDEVEDQASDDKEEGYLAKHWHGKYSLSRSFWVNNMLFNIVFAAVIGYWVLIGVKTEDPVYLSRVILGMSIFGYVILYPWQVVGLWRSANNQIDTTNNTFWPRTIKLLVVLGVLASIVDLVKEDQFYKDLYHDSFTLTKEHNYNIRLTGETIFLDGEFNYGISDHVDELLKENPDVSRIVLDSTGGLLYEASRLSKLILTNSLNTYTHSGCYSACTIAHVSGNRRYISKDARLGFHQYSYYRPKSELDKLDLFDSQKEDAKFFRKRGVSKAFTDKMYKADPEDMWYPTTKELFNYGLVHGYTDSNIYLY